MSAELRAQSISTTSGRLHAMLHWWQTWNAYKTETLSKARAAGVSELTDAYAHIQVEPAHEHAKFTFGTHEEFTKALNAIPDGHGPYFYSAIDNPTIISLEDNLARMETYPLCDHDQDWQERVRALAFSCGAAAISAVILDITEFFSRDGCILASDDTYSAADMMFLRCKGAKIPVVRFGPDDFERTLSQQRGNVSCVYVETPSHTRLINYPLESIAKTTTARGIPLIVDSTLATPYCMQPMLLGADIVIHSTTKYINGKGDRLGGAVIGPKSFMRPDTPTGPALLLTRRLLGSVPAVTDAHAINTSMRDLPARMREHCANARRIAGYLSTHPAITAVNYPSLISHPTRDIAIAQMRDFGAIITADACESGRGFHDKLRVFKHGVSYGDAHSLAHIINATTGTVRLSIGREPAQDLLDDLAQALAPSR